jgi:hypothetical protein
MDDQERQYFVNTIKDLERAKLRWKAVALAAIASAAFIFVVTGGINMAQRFQARAMMQQAADERARAEALAREEAYARQLAEASRRRAEAAKAGPRP